ncbi:MAG: hypothetical protein KDJ99_28395 [Candidatus Competibacteraceae bacterium]|nr:hypothetical protein [Candidatus Competibacteraceae bacterium]
MPPANFQQLANFIWSVADLLRGPYRPPQYERVITLFPRQTLSKLAPDELTALLGLNPVGKGKFVEYEADPNLKDFENIPSMMLNWRRWKSGSWHCYGK